MIWTENWQRISSRISGLIESTDLLLATFGLERGDPDSVVRKTVLPELKQLSLLLDAFNAKYAETLPSGAASALKEFLVSWRPPEPATGFELSALQSVVPLAIFRRAFEYLADDREVEVRALTELAFEHLKRLLAVDERVRDRWKSAFEARETRCEKLGAVHLLHHGIWAFKVSAVGAATDLVYAEPIADQIPSIRRTARVLVLTEWKLVRDQSEVEEKAEDARRQARLYSEGILAELELKTVRYVILVSKENLEVPPDKIEGATTFRHILLPIEPETPSKEARQARRQKAKK